MRALLSLLVAVALAGVLAPAAAAQARSTWEGPADPPTAEELARARALYELGTEAAETHRWADALASFEQSYALSGASPALFSIGYALRALGRVRAARDAFDQLLTLHPEVEPSIRQEAERLRREVAARVAVLSLLGLPSASEVRVVLDAEHVPDDGARPLPLETDPGEHSLRVDRDGYEPFLWEGALEPGARREVEVAMSPLGTGSGPDEGEGEDGSILTHPLFWTAVGVVVLATGVIVGVVLYEGAQLEPRTGEHITL